MIIDSMTENQRGGRGTKIPDEDADEDEGEKFDWLIFLGGTNDLGWGKKPDEIWSEIVKITDVPRVKDGAKVLICTVPECGVKRDSLDAKRDALNNSIKGDAREGV
jgi:hypothetical protein